MKDKRLFQLKAVYEGAVLYNEMQTLSNQRDVLKKCGLDKEAWKLQEQINAIVVKQKEVKEKAKQQRLQLVREMLLCFVAGDLATTCADVVEKVFEKLTYGQEREGGNAFAELFRLQAKEWNKLVTLVDGQCGDERVSMLYSDMAEVAVERALEVIYEVIDECMQSKNGKKLL